MKVMDGAAAEIANEDNTAVRVSIARPHAFAVLFDRHYDAIWRYLCRRVGPTGADDLAGEAFLRAFTKRADYEPSPLGARPWLYGIATNLLREQIRREHRQMRAYARVVQPLVESTVFEEVDGRLDAALLRPAVIAALSQLDPVDRDALMLLALTELGYEGIAAATGAPIGTVRSRLNRARRLVRAELKLNSEQQRMVSPLHLGPHEYWYVEDVTAGPRAQNMKRCGNACYDIGVERWWVGARRFVSHYYVLADSAKPTTITQTPPNVPMTAARYSPRWSGIGPGYDRTLSYQRMLTTPTDVNSLRNLVLNLGVSRYSKPVSRIDKEGLIFSNIGGILEEPRVPARMLSGLYRLLATLSGASVVGRVTDTLGRQTIEVTYKLPEPSGSINLALLFDAKTYVLLDTHQTATGKYPSYSYTAYVRSGLVSNIGALPKAGSHRSVISTLQASS